ncbi:PSD1 and planctomycete cytochrome C domain-containing protein [Roseibacillus ishigakijimensis]|uniref:PSD1 domain-containing protein n=1 Tax=Roseibacillus ishigakijimensis TaxID=454146 RepID=A0A934VM24_9BACT|nr:PSD1 and planctomycete cytochrome C domain-containing protein [Roseibacillus ishigakijimensis]MBK1833822.1 PSD1 domain-containing protein [Roseibacillus ishigakijimensis]
MMDTFRTFVAAALASSSLFADEPVDFSYQILPLLSDACFHCHGPDENTREADLRLDTEEGLYGLLKGDAVVKKGDPAGSLLYQRITATDPDDQMPPPKNHRQLKGEEKELIRRWIAEGAEWGRHWSFEPIKKPAVPGGEDHSVRNEIDAFVRARLRGKGLTPSPEAEPETLLRRVALDLTGLPPAPDLAEAFLRDYPQQGEKAYEGLVDALLASPSFGERMAMYWMKVARFSESDGYQLDQVRSQYPWRDWVIQAFNRNLPYDQFILEQTAGDLLPNPTQDQIIATGFNRNHMINGEGGVDPEETRIEVVADRTETTSTAFLGLTMACARCHDHKFDPITQEDYFRFFAYFNNVDENGKSGHQAKPFLELEVPAAHRQQVEAYQANTKHHHISFPEGNRIRVAVMKDREGEPRPTHILDRGTWDQPTREVTPAPPAFLAGAQDYPANRLGLAQWMVDDENPLTARVTVNRFWELFFGRGIVKTQEDFGIQSERPSHPLLLDWLAADFREQGWDVKRLCRQIVLSATYRQTSVRDEESQRSDPDNVFLARGARFRYPSWMLRDQALAVSGLLNEELFGPSVRPYQPKNIWFTPTAGKIRYEQAKGEQLYRKSLYTFWRRTIAPANLFDASPRRICEVNVRRTNTPLHALVTLNDVTYVEAARVLAQEVLRSHAPQEAMVAAFRRVLLREPQEAELGELQSFFEEARQYYQANPGEAQALLSVGEAQSETEQPALLAAFSNVALLLLNTDETLTHQ